MVLHNSNLKVRSGEVTVLSDYIKAGKAAKAISQSLNGENIIYPDALFIAKSEEVHGLQEGNDTSS